ncbi:aromatic ring-hydroxylating dioxygenase subunit alpha [Amycolatopsis acidiphila]|uniref:Rieske 2Fe-2S domain-containing protein n=1 Tax=Amycolatopsis acidiphila TaxID=715473 RepID=A0A558AL91_9PSEU|nr:aromatic ring-hydroxylating dioxygenase subunit alpha [Amycolatopsis acidiphila]TVT25024.1 Rieske 2Fe-2S domain-containing protein [Amycolatopsis acidiphila]UIJ57467.1 aromatic ring-hydroxylating dioxygenase subunit alpha [Amycolatopsis acidiphila]GHG96252.1 aromatic-ring-hydroxylating dioxygenase subunit alpha [Amycolatopsis acidiphila]
MPEPFVIDNREDSLFQVHREVFTSPEIFERERELIFGPAWLYAGHESELPRRNDFRTRDVGGRPVIFTRDRHGEVRVLLNTCLHRGASLCRHPAGNAKIFTCFYHGWAYRNSGELVNVPSVEDYAGAPTDVYRTLPAPRVESYRGFYFVNFSGDAPDLRTWLGTSAYLLDLAVDQSEDGIEILPGTHSYTLQANWKLLVENSVDGYHAKSVHHTYFEMMMELGQTPPMLGDSDTNGVPPAGLGTEFGNGHATLMYPGNGLPLANEAVTHNLAALRSRAVERFGESYATAVFDLARNTIFFPNFVLIDLNFGMILRTITPLGPDRTQVSSWQLTPRGLDEESLRYRIDNALTFWGPAGLATPDDVEALEQAQRGFGARREMPWSDISKGMGKARPAANDELQMRAWWRQWNAVMTGEPLPREVEEFIPFDVPVQQPQGA